ncbi:MAG: hypothetical protein CFH10_01833 [Alphaproteobacteria bacterium MarineAlpha4_Bin2]|nr:MAG: hypothetical protein CFH10_01833 [Alphaproteobacteria bacterium MarineAlpha4_Bin2]
MDQGEGQLPPTLVEPSGRAGYSGNNHDSIRERANV